MKYSKQELARASWADLLRDARTARHQAQHGPFYPPTVTASDLNAYAEECRRAARGYRAIFRASRTAQREAEAQQLAGWFPGSQQEPQV
jgi:hypothetical protein